MCKEKKLWIPSVIVMDQKGVKIVFVFICMSVTHRRTRTQSAAEQSFSKTVVEKKHTNIHHINGKLPKKFITRHLCKALILSWYIKTLYIRLCLPSVSGLYTNLHLWLYIMFSGPAHTSPSLPHLSSPSPAQAAMGGR